MSDYRDCSLRDMAKRLGVSASYLSDVEHGKKGLSIELFRKMESMGYTYKFLAEFSIMTVKRNADKL